jgi:dUTP pyrophosphatase
VKIKFKKMHEDAVIPTFGNPGDAGADLRSVSVKYDAENDVFEYDSGVSVEIPEGFFGLVVPRSSIYKTDLMLSNHAGVIDSGYRGSIKSKFKIIQAYDSIENINIDSGIVTGTEFDEYRYYLIYPVKERFLQLLILPIVSNVQYEEVDELSETKRGEGGFGSTGK